MNKLYIIALCILSLSVASLHTSNRNVKNKEESNNPLKIIIERYALIKSLSTANYRLCDVVVRTYPFYKKYTDQQCNYHALYDIQDHYGTISYDLSSLPPEIQNRFMKDNNPQTLQLGYSAYYDSRAHFIVYLKSLDKTSELPIIPKNPESSLRLGARLLVREIEKEEQCTAKE